MRLKQSLLLISAIIVAVSIVGSCDNSPKPEVAAQPVDTHLGELMGQMQYYVVKLGLSLQHKNQPLAAFYMNEVNETYQDIVDKKITHETYNISDMIQQLLSASKGRLESSIAKNDTASFLSSYHAMIMSCNNCHLETNHAFIVIEEPTEKFNGQNFGVQRSPYSE